MSTETTNDMDEKIITELDAIAGRDRDIWDARGDHGHLVLAVEVAQNDMPNAIGALQNLLGLANEWDGTEEADLIREALSALFADD